MTNRRSWRDRARAVRAIPLETVLQVHGARRDHGDKRRWRTSREIITVTAAKFYSWTREAGGGGAIDLVMHLEGLGCHAAIQWLERRFGGRGGLPPVRNRPSAARANRATGSPSPVFRLPVPNAAGLVHVRRYLTDWRNLRSDIVQRLIESKALYADARSNAVFVMVAGKPNRPVGAELRGTRSKWCGLAVGTRKDAGFFWVGPHSRRIVLCESAIDAISCVQLLGDCVAISMAGARSHARWLPLLIHRGYVVANGFDNDEAGNRSASKMINRYPAIHRLRPPAHDWNASLKAP